MKLIAIEAIRLTAQHTAQPGEAFELDDVTGCAELLQIGAAREDVAPAEAPEEYHEEEEPTPIAALAGDGAGADAAVPAPVAAAKPARSRRAAP